MSLLTNRRAFLPLCLTFGTLLCAQPVLADAPIPPPVPAMQAKTLTLQNTVPSDILKALHRD